MDDDKLLNVKTETLPSEDAHAKIAPSSWGAQDTELTERDDIDKKPFRKKTIGEDGPEAVCRVCSLILIQPPDTFPCPCCSFQIKTFPSYEQEASICPYFGCAQATCQTGPVCL